MITALKNLEEYDLEKMENPDPDVHDLGICIANIICTLVILDKRVDAIYKALGVDK